MKTALKIRKGLNILKSTRIKYSIPKSMLTPEMKLYFTDYRSVQIFVTYIKKIKTDLGDPTKTVEPGALNSMILIDEILRYIMAKYKQDMNPTLLPNSIKWLGKNPGRKTFYKIVKYHVRYCTALELDENNISIDTYLSGEENNKPIIDIELEDTLIAKLDNENPAFHTIKEFINNKQIINNTPYTKLMNSLEKFIQTQPTYGPYNQPLLEMLRTPRKISPNSLEGQLVYIKDHWRTLLDKSLLERILRALDMLKEEQKLGIIGPAPTKVLEFSTSINDDKESEYFSPETNWMSELALIAKNILVWFDQLSKKYGYKINKLDQIPDEELDTLSRWGFTGLWLIGLWKRSPASQQIKQICGNPEAAASAYSIYDYVIDETIGGEESLANFQARAMRYGIRLACDMIPNHVGIYSKLVIEHPEYFIQLDYPPYPSYSFTSPNLSKDNRVKIYIDDNYWNKTDAAVVFKREDTWTGNQRYIYHGNDGTSMPWNDTAQLDFLKSEVREMVIQTILHVAGKFPIIRFDAAMTLTKRHFHRLWYPEPGTGGDIPSRAQFGLSREEFNKMFPQEFWREVVDRVSQETPGTLLLAEAFWLMEGYFVRTLGMHRVYNSAFMNMLKMEENDKYRSVIKNILEFNPEILRRLVNFMNNPDEETAITQFGTGDKYFGIATLMVTMPGLPMFGHGQVEGFKEKYGMEYQKAYWNEPINWDFVNRHEKEIFPLMKKRFLFSGISNFSFYDYFQDDGKINENVFAYSNKSNNELALIVYNNNYESTSGWIKSSVPMLVTTNDSSKKLVTINLHQWLNIDENDDSFITFQDHVNGLEYIRSGKEILEQGLYTRLNGYQYHVFTDFKVISNDEQGYYHNLTNYLQGNGVQSLNYSLKELRLRPVHEPLKKLLNLKYIQDLENSYLEPIPTAISTNKFETFFLDNLENWFKHITEFLNLPQTEKIVSKTNMKQKLFVLFTLNSLLQHEQLNKPNDYPDSIKELHHHIPGVLNPGSMEKKLLYAWLTIHNIDTIPYHGNHELLSSILMDALHLDTIVKDLFLTSGIPQDQVEMYSRLLKILVAHKDWGHHLIQKEIGDKLTTLLDNEDTKIYLKCNWYNDTLWFNRESFSNLLYWFFTITMIDLISHQEDVLNISEQTRSQISNLHNKLKILLHLSKQSGYKVDNFLDRVIKLKKGKK